MNASPRVAVIATAWGSRYGGINSFSTDLCCALGRVLSEHRVVCICVSATDADIKHAEAADVALLPLNLASGGSTKDCAAQIVNLLSVKGWKDSVGWWIGHDAITGELARACAAECRGSNCAVLMHMSYEDYSYVKHTLSEARAVAERIQTQHELLQSVEVGFAVGPLLFQRLKEIRGHDKASGMLVPGLGEQAAPLQATERVNAITFGRFDSAELLTKQAPLVTAAFARAIRAGFDSRNQILMNSSLRVIGVTEDVGLVLRTLAEAEAGRVWNLQLLDFVDDKFRLRNLLLDCNMCLMLSWHEGFGLSAWEAIGAAIPVILSRNSGVFRLLDSIGGSAVGCVLDLDVHGRGDGHPNEEDIEAAKRAIFEVASDIPKALANAKSLRYLLRLQFNFTWDRTAQELAHMLQLPVVSTMLDRSPAVDQRILAEPTDVVEGLETSAHQRILGLAQANYSAGEYIKALEVLDTLKHDPKAHATPTTAMDATLLEAEVCLRLNKYPRARALIEKASNQAAERSDWQRYIRARSVENTILRDQGKYAEAAELAELLLRIAEKEHFEATVEKVHRLAARSFALYGRWDEAVVYGNKALESAKQKHDHDAEAKAALALGEAFRHGLQQPTAVKWYTDSRNLAGRAGNTDCFLWAVLGLSDSLFLLSDVSGSREQLNRLQQYFGSHVHPLEMLHLRLSLLSSSCKEGTNVVADMNKLVLEYATLGITWPREYADGLANGDFSRPKRF